MYKILIFILFPISLHANDFVSWTPDTTVQYFVDSCALFMNHAFGRSTSVSDYKWRGLAPRGDLWRISMSTGYPPPAKGANLELLRVDLFSQVLGTNMYLAATENFGLLRHGKTEMWETVSLATKNDMWLLSEAKKHLPPRELGRVDLINMDDGRSERVFTKHGYGSKISIPLVQGVQSTIAYHKKSQSNSKKFTHIIMTHIHPFFEVVTWPKTMQSLPT